MHVGKLVLILAVLLLTAGFLQGWVEDFSQDPFENGFVLVGPNESALVDGTPVPAFQWEEGHLIINYHSQYPSTRIMRLLGETVDENSSFYYRAVFTISSANFLASDEDFMEINFALGNSETTGLNRTGPPWGQGGEPANVFNYMEFSFFPNISQIFQYGPTLGISAFGPDVGTGDAFSNFAFNFGEDTDLHDEVEENLLPSTGLPLDTPLEALVECDGNTKLAEITVARLDTSPKTVLITREVPLDVSTLEGGFQLDTFMITTYYDHADYTPDTPSLIATVVYDEIEFESGEGSTAQFNQGWNLVSFPLLQNDQSAGRAFAGVANMNNILEGNLFAYVPGQGYLPYSSGFSDVVLGQGYWIRLDHEATEIAVGQACSEDFSISLHAGWNLVGHPFPYPVSWADCSVKADGEIYTLQEAAELNLISPVAFYFDNGYKTLQLEGGDDSCLRPWRGYWILAFEDVELIVPANN